MRIENKEKLEKKKKLKIREEAKRKLITNKQLSLEERVRLLEIAVFGKTIDELLIEEKYKRERT
ncbi:hypothetical protein [Geoglobus acetivorans]|uniref:Mobile element protein n=1 Tax=Geoglobus acetivorans TaxID=565033 RepID=A0ABZ3H1W5_GEOAI|nr:hypothetical protein [Geoglobus acetivorans]